jgi:hypothetical protein
LTRFFIVPTIEMTFGARWSGTWIWTWRSMVKTKPSRLLPTIGSSRASQVVRLRAGVGPVEREDEGRHQLRRVDARVDGVLAGAQGLLPDAAVSGADDAAELELLAGCVQCGQTDERLDDGHLTLVHHQHRDHLHAYQEGVEEVRTVQQRIMLQADPPAVVQEALEVLIVVVQVVLGAEQEVDHLGIGGTLDRFQRGHVVEAAEPAGQVAGVERLALQRGDQTDHVDVALRRDDRDFEVLRPQFERARRELVVVRQRRELRSDRESEDAASREDEEADRMDRHQGPGREHRALHTLLAVVGDEPPQVREVAEGRVVPGALGADRQRPSDLGDDHADLAGLDLDPGILGDRVHRPQLEPRPRHQQVGLVAGLAVERDGVVVGELAPEPLGHQPDLGGADAVERLRDDDEEDQDYAQGNARGDAECLHDVASRHEKGRLRR